MQPVRKIQDANWRHGWWIPNVTRALFRHTGLNFDRRHGVDTQTEIPMTALSCRNNAHERIGYVPTPVKHFAFAMGLVPRPLDCWSFLDIGSGKGRAVLLAIGYPFRRVTGVELAPELHAIAQDNLRRYLGPR